MEIASTPIVYCIILQAKGTYSETLHAHYPVRLASHRTQFQLLLRIASDDLESLLTSSNRLNFLAHILRQLLLWPLFWHVLCAAGVRLALTRASPNRQELTTNDVRRNSPFCKSFHPTEPAADRALKRHGFTSPRTAQMAEPLPRPSPRSANSTQYDFDEEASEELSTISLCEFLDQDPRPTFVLDLDSDHLDYGGIKQTLRPVFCNTALRLHDRLLDRVTGSAIEATDETLGQTSFTQFRTWATSITAFDDSRDVFPQTFLYQGLLWTGSTARQRWRLVSGIRWCDVPHGSGDLHLDQYSHADARGETNALDMPGKQSRRSVAETMASNVVSEQPSNIVDPKMAPLARSNTLLSSAPTYPEDKKGRTSNPTTSGDTSNGNSKTGGSIELISPSDGVPDWTVENPQGVLTEHMTFARNVDWGATPLGPMNSWSREFREICNLLMRNPHPAVCKI